MKKIQQIITAPLACYLTASLIFSGCAKESTDSAPPAKIPSSGKQVLENSNYWEVEENQVSDSTLVLSKKLTDEGFLAAEKRMRETSLKSLNLPSDLNAQAYTIKSRGDDRINNAVYIAPKLYLYRKSDKARVQVRQMGENVLIPLHAILVDGFSGQVPSANGIDTVELPQSYRVDYNRLKTALMNRGFGENLSFGPLDGCPKQFTLTVAGESYDITPKNLKGSDQCELNRPFTLNLIVPKEKADFIVNEALYFNEVDVQATFEVMVGFVEADTRIQLDRSKIFEKLSASISVQKPPYAKGTVEAHLKKIIQSETMNVFIKGDRNDIVNQLFQAAYDSFVIPFDLPVDKSSSTPDCTTTAACVNISYSKNTENRNLEVSYQQYSTTLTGQVISSFAKAQQILFPEVVFQSQGINGISDYVSNLKHNERDIMVTVNQGSIVELHLENLKYQLDNTKVNVSVGGGNVCASRDFTKRCEWHLHWIEVNRHYAGIPFSSEFTPAGNMLGSPGDELFLKIKSPTGETTECSLTQFNAIGNGNQYIIKLENSDTCKPFADEMNKKIQYSVTFVNRLKDVNPLKQIGDGRHYNYTDRYEKKDGDPSYDSAELGGHQPKSITTTEREIQLKLRMNIRKYDVSN